MVRRVAGSDRGAAAMMAPLIVAMILGALLCGVAMPPDGEVGE